jgi:hypothetical protein
MMLAVVCRGKNENSNVFLLSATAKRSLYFLSLRTRAMSLMQLCCRIFSQIGAQRTHQRKHFFILEQWVFCSGSEVPEYQSTESDD